MSRKVINVVNNGKSANFSLNISPYIPNEFPGYLNTLSSEQVSNFDLSANKIVLTINREESEEYSVTLYKTNEVTYQGVNDEGVIHILMLGIDQNIISEGYLMYIPI